MISKIHRKYWFTLAPIQIMVGGFFLITLFSACLLTLPQATRNGIPQSFVNSLFMAFSGISTTGLAVLDIYTSYSFFGQMVMLVTIQLGGIGYIALIILAMGMFGKRTSFHVAGIAGEAMAGYETRNLIRFSIFVISVTLLFEVMGAFFLYHPFRQDMEMPQAMWFAIFHSINAFCTAGFSTFPDSLMRYSQSIPVNITVNILSFVGALGFIVIYDLLHLSNLSSERKKGALNLHTKLVLISFTAIVLAGTLVLFFNDANGSNLSLGNRLTTSLFQSISASSTDGFNTIDISILKPTILIFIMFQMFTGAAPGSTGGGIKVTTFSTVLLFLFWQLKGRGNTIITAGKREIGNVTAEKALGITLWFVIIIFIDLFILSISEGERFSLMPYLFETVSALGNTGLSMGVTSALSNIGKLALTFTMFVGRVGPLAVGFALAGKERDLSIRLPEEDLFIG